MIEHRHRSRISTEKEVSIYHRGILVAECRIKDISAEGIAIWSGPIQYHRNTLLELEFAIEQDGKRRKFKQQALVVHSSADVLGLIFIESDQRSQQELVLMLDTYRAKSKQSMTLDKSYSIA